MIKIFENDTVHIMEDEAAFDKFANAYMLINAAGGIVRNRQNRILMIRRLGKWDFPKGKMEVGETDEVTALREVMEETGLTSLRIVSPLPCTYHTYRLRETAILKRTFWFEMLVDKPQIPVPQTEEDITEIRWVNESDVGRYLNESYSSLRDFWQSYCLKDSE